MERVDYESLIIADLLRFHSDGTLNITPWYQRRSVWSNPQRAYLINTIFETKPVPTLYIRQIIDLEKERGIKEVVDGQQRIRSVIGYRSGEFAARHPGHVTKVHFSELHRREQAEFLSTALSVGYLIGADDPDVIEIFGRINSISKSLNPQEKRNARYGGDFKQFCLKEAARRLPFWRSANVFSSNDISRMQEVQFISDIVINLIEGLSDFSANKIDTYYKRYDEDFQHEDEVAKRLDFVFDQLTSVDPQIFKDTIFSVPQNLFSLIIVVGEIGHIATRDNVALTILELDQMIRGFDMLEELTADQATVRSAFVGGNLHRIRARRLRDEIIRRELTK